MVGLTTAVVPNIAIGNSVPVEPVMLPPFQSNHVRRKAVEEEIQSMTDLLQKYSKWEWSSVCEQAFNSQVFAV